MKSTGNDIVALKVIDKQRTNHSAFYSKFITPSEQALYKRPEIPFENFVWLLWAVKEAAYKYLKRGDANLVFSPSKIIIGQLDAIPAFKTPLLQTDQLVDAYFKGDVSSGSHKLYFRAVFNSGYIAAVVNDDIDFKNVYWGVQLIDSADHESQSKAVRKFALDRLINIFPDHKLSIEKNPEDCPVLLNGDQEMNVPISLAHHDRYISYSFSISK